MKRTRSVARAAHSGDAETGLEALRDRLAAAVDEVELLPQLAANARELRIVLAALASSGVGATEDEIDELKARRNARRRA